MGSFKPINAICQVGKLASALVGVLHDQLRASRLAIA